VKAAELDYELPPELIAQTPLEQRDSSRLFVHDRATGETRHRRFDQLAEELPAGTLVVVNDTRVLPARLRLERPGGGVAEVLLLERLGPNGTWEGLARPSRKLRPGQRLGPVELIEPLGEGRWKLRLEGAPAGEAPLPPYINEPLADPERYQTVYAAQEGSAAAPTAGLHFTPELLARFDVERVTLHVGLDTFRPLAVDVVEAHPLHSERYEVSEAAWAQIQGRTESMVLILDREMPGIDGMDLCRRARLLPSFPPLYILMVTGASETIDITTGLDAGADDYVIKPFKPAELKARAEVGMRIVALQEGMARRLAELEQALANVKQLRGLLPMCAYCKKIRVDDKYWQQLEGYLSDHSDAEFSHGICPECFPSVIDQIRDEMS